MPALYLVPTPIGNLEDITLRALRVLKGASLVAAEDTRTARKLLSHYGIRQRLLSYNEHNMRARTPQILAALEHGDVALISEAGTPGISDPGYELVQAAIDAGSAVVPLPGASAVLAAIVVSGLPARRFKFLGFLPRRPGERRRLLESLKDESATLIVFESPHRLRQTLADIQSAWGDRRIAVCRELTKAFEEIFRGTLSQARGHFTEPRGEFTVVLEGASDPAPAASLEQAAADLRGLRASGVSGRDAVRQVAKATGLPHRDVYRLWLEREQNAGENDRRQRSREGGEHS